MPKTTTHIKGMSNNTLYILLFVVFLVVVGGGFLMYRKNYYTFTRTSEHSGPYIDGRGHSGPSDSEVGQCKSYCNSRYIRAVDIDDCKKGCDTRRVHPTYVDGHIPLSLN